MFQQNSAPAHHAHDTLAFIARGMPQFIEIETTVVPKEFGFKSATEVGVS